MFCKSHLRRVLTSVIRSSFLTDFALRNSYKTSKTISREKGQRIVNVIKKDPSAVTYSSQFKFWVKKKRFELINHPVLGVKDVLCLPAKNQVT